MKDPEAAVVTALCLLALSGITALFFGCGSESGQLVSGAPVVNISCDASSCTILVHGADTITTFHDGEFYWSEDIVPPGRRYTNRDAAPESSITVVACNDYGCTERKRP